MPATGRPSEIPVIVSLSPLQAQLLRVDALGELADAEHGLQAARRSQVQAAVLLAVAKGRFFERDDRGWLAWAAVATGLARRHLYRLARAGAWLVQTVPDYPALAQIADVDILGELSRLEAGELAMFMRHHEAGMAALTRAAVREIVRRYLLARPGAGAPEDDDADDGKEATPTAPETPRSRALADDAAIRQHLSTLVAELVGAPDALTPAELAALAHVLAEGAESLAALAAERAAEAAATPEAAHE